MDPYEIDLGLWGGNMGKLHLPSNPATDSGTYSSGLWSSSLPLTNLQTQQPKQVARSTSALTASTKFIVALPRTVPISMFALIANNFTNEATVRLRVADN